MNQTKPTISSIEPIDEADVDAGQRERMRTGVFVSDLHLFSPRSIADHTKHKLAEFKSESCCVVLGGDIFDFRWSAVGNHDQTLRAATDWLESLLERTRDAQVVYLPGNHDCHPEFLDRLNSLAKDCSRFAWRSHHFQLNSNLFLHGDILDAGSYGDLSRYRSKFHHRQPKGRVAQRCYDLAVAMRVHKAIPTVRHRPQLTCQRLHSALASLNLDSGDSVKRVYFGHTHVSISGLKLNGIEYFNPGAGLRHMQLQPLEF